MRARSFRRQRQGLFNGSFFREANGDADFDMTMKKSLQFEHLEQEYMFADFTALLSSWRCQI